MLMAILINVCLQADGASCRQERLDFAGSPMACMVAAQPIVAEWSDAHPDWRVRSWKCAPG